MDMQNILIGCSDTVLGTVGLQADGSWKLEARGNHGRELAETVDSLYAYYRRKDRTLTPETFLKLLPKRVRGFYTWAAPAWTLPPKRHHYPWNDRVDALIAEIDRQTDLEIDRASVRLERRRA